MRPTVKRIRNGCGLPGSGQEEREATGINFLTFSGSTVLQKPEAQGELIELLVDVIDARRWEVFFTMLLEHMREEREKGRGQQKGRRTGGRAACRGGGVRAQFERKLWQP
jgi:hypothetical protein